MRHSPHSSQVCLDKYPKYSPLSERSIEKVKILHAALESYFLLPGMCRTKDDVIREGRLALGTWLSPLPTSPPPPPPPLSSIITQITPFTTIKKHTTTTTTTTANTKFFFLANLRVK